MESLLAEKLASEYVRLIAEGWNPDLDEFLGRIPEEHREHCREQIDDLVGVAEESARPDEEPKPLVFTLFDEDESGPEPEVAEAPGDLEAVDEGEVWEEESDEPEPEPLEEVIAAEAPVEEPAEPVGPQRLTKEEAMAMWDTQRVRS